MEASTISSAALGAGLEIVFGNFIRIILEVRRGNALFRKTLEDLEDLLQSFLLSIRRIDSLNREFDRPGEIDGLKDLIKKGEALVIKCSKIHKYNYVLKPFYIKKLTKLEESIRRYHTTTLQLQQSADIKEGLFEVKVLSTKFSSLGIGAYSGGNVGGISGKSGFVGVCSPPGLKIKPVGLEIPLKDLKEKLLKTFDWGSNLQPLNLETTLIQLNRSSLMEPDFLSEEDALNQLENLLRSIGPDPILLVLDDVWSGAEPLVEKLTFPIPGYKILVTSRFEFPRFGSSYKLRTLSDADAITLFHDLAFLSDGNSYRPNEDVINKIVEVCKGFPLAISVVGKSLCGKSSAEWSKRIKECSRAASVIANFEVELLNCLQTSVDALNDNAAAKECYKDLGSFPEDQKIPASTLVDMWVERHNLDEDDAIANVYELSNRNLLELVLTRKDACEDYVFLNVKQHDILRELAIIQSNTGSFEQRKRLFIDITGNKFPEWWVAQRHLFIRAKLLSICTDEMFSSSWYSMEAPEVEVLVLHLQTKNYTLPLFMGGMDKLKVLIVANYGFFPAVMSNFQLVGSLLNLKRIRLEKVSLPSFFLSSVQLEKLEKISLVMCNIGQAFSNSTICMPNVVEINIDYCSDVEELPDGFCNLVRLKKLSITNCHKLLALPEEIGNLVNLEVLRLNSCIDLLELPETIGGLHNLRILDISECLSLKKLPEQIGDLNNLRKLHMIDCSRCELPWSVADLVDLEEVTGDEETTNSWKDWETFLPNLKIKVHKDINIDWLPNFC
ncbi:hypothetical protein JCGZ_12341 [Jatropha curcas]|uniref:RPW8 domain-containing protein n=1 Tax=Jatropha curcas TaxID=180498 RepID=A0A067KHY6_JATCU|nr:hypothetical protein JCGZ_12341 [Jatropha curcas]